MNKHIIKYVKHLTINSLIDSAKFSDLVKSIDCNFPEGYLEYMRETNGGEGFVKEDGKFVRFYKLEELSENNAGYQFDQYAPDLFLIANDGGGEAFCLKRKEGTFVRVPFEAKEEQYRENVGSSFLEFLAYLSLPWKDDDEDDEQQRIVK